MKAFHGSQQIKDKYVNRMQQHIDADELIKGEGWSNGKGCAVGCTLNSYNHKLYETEIGVPEWVAHLNDVLHENTSDEIWPTLQLRFLKSVKPGITFNEIKKNINIFVQRRNLDRVNKLNISFELKNEIITAIEKVIDFLVTESAAESAAGSAVQWATELNAESAAESARYAAESARYAAESAAESAAEYDVIANEFIRLIKLTKVNQ